MLNPLPKDGIFPVIFAAPTQKEEVPHDNFPND